MSTQPRTQALTFELAFGMGLMVLGTAAGGVMGMLAGPPGVIVGAIMGCAVGTLLGTVLDAVGFQARVHDEELDHEIGVIGGDLGAARSIPPPHPTAEHPV
jgi:hypothetical protein